jgi:F1F0 ATPase subunit 2
MMLDLLIGFAGGLVAGIVFFAGLQRTVARLATTRRPLLVATSSFVSRSALVAVILVASSSGRLSRVVAALIGILAVRTVMVARVRRTLQRPAAGEASWT